MSAALILSLRHARLSARLDRAFGRCADLTAAVDDEGRRPHNPEALATADREIVSLRAQLALLADRRERAMGRGR